MRQRGCVESLKYLVIVLGVLTAAVASGQQSSDGHTYPQPQPSGPTYPHDRAPSGHTYPNDYCTSATLTTIRHRKAIYATKIEVWRHQRGWLTDFHRRLGQQDAAYARAITEKQASVNAQDQSIDGELIPGGWPNMGLGILSATPAFWDVGNGPAPMAVNTERRGWFPWFQPAERYDFDKARELLDNAIDTAEGEIAAIDKHLRACQG